MNLSESRYHHSNDDLTITQLPDGSEVRQLKAQGMVVTAYAIENPFANTGKETDQPIVDYNQSVEDYKRVYQYTLEGRAKQVLTSAFALKLTLEGTIPNWPFFIALLEGQSQAVTERGEVIPVLEKTTPGERDEFIANLKSEMRAFNDAISKGPVAVVGGAMNETNLVSFEDLGDGKGRINITTEAKDTARWSRPDKYPLNYGVIEFLREAGLLVPDTEQLD